jgi:hypothetical protein
LSGLDDNSFTTRVVAASTTLTQSDYFVQVAAPAANVVLTLPAIATVPAGRPYYVSRDNTATQTVTLTPNAADKIEGGTAGVGVAVGAAATTGGCIVVSDGVSSWWRVSKY